MTTKVAVQLIKASLRLFEEQLDNGECSEEELISIAEDLSKSLNVGAEIKTLSRAFGESEGNVRSVISRRNVPKSARKRIVTYNWGWFFSIVPEKWKSKF